MALINQLGSEDGAIPGTDLRISTELLEVEFDDDGQPKPNADSVIRGRIERNDALRASGKPAENTPSVIFFLRMQKTIADTAKAYKTGQWFSSLHQDGNVVNENISYFNVKVASPLHHALYALVILEHPVLKSYKTEFLSQLRDSRLLVTAGGGKLSSDDTVLTAQLCTFFRAVIKDIEQHRDKQEDRHELADDIGSLATWFSTYRTSKTPTDSEAGTHIHVNGTNLVREIDKVLPIKAKLA